MCICTYVTDWLCMSVVEMKTKESKLKKAIHLKGVMHKSVVRQKVQCHLRTCHVIIWPVMPNLDPPIHFGSPPHIYTHEPTLL